jgi:hypothetical protein
MSESSDDEDEDKSDGANVQIPEETKKVIIPVASEGIDVVPIVVNTGSKRKRSIDTDIPTTSTGGGGEIPHWVAGMHICTKNTTNTTLGAFFFRRLATAIRPT